MRSLNPQACQNCRKILKKSGVKGLNHFNANDWYPADMKEIKQFLGLLFLMRIIHKPAIHIVLVQGSLVLYFHLQCSYEQILFLASPYVSALQ